MILGECPYEGCEGSLHLPIADDCPAFQKHNCEECGRVIWTLHSRWNPQSWTEDGFTAEYEVDEVTRNITKREFTSAPNTLKEQ